MSSLYSDRVTYPELLKFYYACGFPLIVGANANSIAHAIMFKWNEMFFPESFPMANKELSYLSGVDSSHIGRYRQHLIDETKIDGTPLFIYISRGKKRAGIYKINTTLTPNKHQTKAIKEPNSHLYGNDHNKQTATEHNDHDPPKAPLIMPNRKEVEKISVPAAGNEKEWKEIRKEIGNTKLPAQIIANILMRIFQTRPEIYGASFQDHEDVANAIGFGLDMDNGWRLLDEAEGKKNPLGYIRSMGNKKGKEWSR